MTDAQIEFIGKVADLPANQDISLDILAEIVQVKYPDLSVKEIKDQMILSLINQC